MLRSRTLPPGWYPQGEKETKQKLENWRETDVGPGRFESVVVPHAAWDFSGELAFRALQRVVADAEVVAVIGGHLRRGNAVRVAPEEGYETPLGPISADADLLDFVKSRMEVDEDTVPDNTVEVQLPMVKHLFPQARGAYMRAPPDQSAVHLGEALAAYVESTGTRVVVVGSTDLTHYGPNFGFTPKGVGEQSVEWVREENDKGFLDATVDMDAERAIEHAVANHSACSPGAAAAAISFARRRGLTNGVLVGYATSYDKHQDASFVGYGGVGFAA